MIFGVIGEEVVKNEALEARLNLPDGWILARTGIQQRHYHSGPTSDLLASAAKQLMEQHRLKPSDIDGVLVTTVTPDHPWPSTASLLTAQLGLSQAWAVDLSAACSGYLYGLQHGTALIRAGMAQKILLLAGDCMSSVVNPYDRNTVILFGDAGTATLLDATTTAGIRAISLETDGRGFQHIHVPAGGSQKPRSEQLADHCLFLDGQPVFKAAVQHMTSSAARLLESQRLNIQDIRFVIPHQANKRILLAVKEQLGFTDDQLLMNVDRRGNTTNASIPLCMAEHRTRFQPGDLLLLTAFGAGYTWGSALWEWPETTS